MKVVLKESKASEPFSFSFVDDQGRAVVRSENYSARKSALNGIESVKKNCQDDGRYEMKEAKNGKYYFNLKAANGQVVATSMMFGAEAERSGAIAGLKRSGPGAAVEEQGA